MERLNVFRTSFAFGTTLTILYAACMFVMETVPRDVVVRFFNSIIHGIDFTLIMRWDMPWSEAVVGVSETFIVGWLVGAVYAWLYNATPLRG